MNNNIDMLRILEANFDSSMEEYNYKIQGYNIIKSPGAVARMVTYIREDILWKKLKGYGNNLSCNWLEIGKGRNKLVVCNYYREFKILGVDGSNSITEQCSRLDEFLEVIKKTRNDATTSGKTTGGSTSVGSTKVDSIPFVTI